MTIEEIARQTIPKAHNKSSLKYNDGSTGDIMREVFACFEDSKTQLKDFAPALKGRSLKETCNNIWRFIKHNIAYKADPAGVQWVKEPVRLWSDKQGDCKSYAIFTASCLYNLGINFCFRFVSFDVYDSTPTHVYVVVPGKDELIIIDAVVNRFNYQKPPTYKIDYAMTAISRLNGISAPAQRRLPTLGGLPTLGADHRIAGGVATVVNGAARRKLLSDSMAQLAPLGLYIFIPAGAGGGQGYKEIQPLLNSDVDILSKLPYAIKTKRMSALITFWSFGAWAGIKVESDFFPQLKAELTRQLGMDPMSWWKNKLNGKVAGIRGSKIGSFWDIATGIQTATSSASQSAASSQTGGASDMVTSTTGATPTKFTPLSIVKSLGNLFGGSDFQWKNGDPSTWAPDESDWSSVGFNPLAGITISTAGLVKTGSTSTSNTTTGGTTYGGYDYGTTTNSDSNTSSQAGMNPLLIAGAVGVAALLFMKKKKR